MTTVEVGWPELVPARLPGGMAASIERKTTQAGDYPPEWPGVAYLMKVQAGWKCERCGVAHSGTMRDGRGLTVHHLDEEKSNLWSWNLSALCQRCHLRIQHKVQWYRLWPWPHSRWMARHIDEFNEWARARGIAEMPLVEVVDRDYSREWAV